MTHDKVMFVLVLVVLAVHVLAWVARPRQIEDAVRGALTPLASQVAALERRLADQEARSERTEAGSRSVESEINRRLQDLMVHVTRIEGTMLSRADYERLHARIDAVGRDVRETLAEIGGEIAEAQTHAEQAITRVQRVEQHLMEKP